MKAKSPVRLGDWFAVPLKTGGYGVGVVARRDPNPRSGMLFGYFFGPRHASVPGLEEVSRLRASDAILVLRFGDLGFLEGRWVVIGNLDDWRMEDWPLPDFGNIDNMTGKACRVRYPDDLRGLGERIPCTVEEAMELPEDVLSGAGAAEVHLRKAIEREEQSKQKK